MVIAPIKSGNYSIITRSKEEYSSVKTLWKIHCKISSILRPQHVFYVLQNNCGRSVVEPIRNSDSRYETILLLQFANIVSSLKEVQNTIK
jgi:hypothetical protein